MTVCVYSDDYSLSIIPIESLKLQHGNKTISEWDWDKIYADSDELSHKIINVTSVHPTYTKYLTFWQIGC